MLFKANYSKIKIAQELKRTRPWVHKWLNRYQSDNDDWFLDQSKEPHHKPHKIEKKLEDTIVKSRLKLKAKDQVDTKYAFHGSVAVHQDLSHYGIRQQDKPGTATIQRVFKRNQLIDKQKPKKKDNDKRFYPQIKAKYPGHLHQLDLVTPRYIKGYGRIISVNRIDVATSRVHLEQHVSKGADSILAFLIQDWQRFGMPKYLQLDNEASFRGSLIHKRSFGKLMRFCLNFGVEIVFIPFNEPWRNGAIESFNSRFDKYFWSAHTFKDLQHLRAESKKFQDQYDHYQGYKKQYFQITQERSYTNRFLPKNFGFDLNQLLPITPGRIHFIRKVNENGNVTIQNENFYIKKQLCNEYVWIILNTQQKILRVFHQQSKETEKQLIKTLDYPLREPVKRRITLSQFSKM